MHIITFTSLFPNMLQLRHGIFIRRRMEHLALHKNVKVSVIAPVPYVPFFSRFETSRYHVYNHIPKQESCGLGGQDIPVFHPRYKTIPGTNLIHVAQSMMRAAHGVVDLCIKEGGEIDLIDGHYLYPDGIAAYHLAQKLNKPLILTARGSDVNYWMKKPSFRKAILVSLDYAHKVICVSEDLKKSLIDMGVQEDKLTVISNGVDQELFKPLKQSETTGKGHTKSGFISVGNLIALKGHALTLEAFSTLTDPLSIIGSGSEEGALRRLVRRYKMEDRVRFISYADPMRLRDYYNRARGSILMSSHEGMPNVVLESIACGTPVIATAVGGVPEVVNDNNGLLLEQRTPQALRHAIGRFKKRVWDQDKIRESISDRTWSVTTDKLYDLLETLKVDRQD